MAATTTSYDKVLSPQRDDAPRAFELRGQMKETGQDIRLHSEGGGVAFIEFDEGAADNWLALRKAARGKALKFLVEIVPSSVPYDPGLEG